MSVEWADAYSADRQPSEREVAEFIASPLWGEVNRYMQESYAVEPIYSYSMCSGQPGWNVKYRKGGRALCTLYPVAGYFIALVVIGAREEVEAGLLVPGCDESIQKLYEKVQPVMGGRWLMIPVKSERVLEDVKRLVGLRRKVKGA